MVIAIGNTLVDQLIEVTKLPKSGQKSGGHCSSAAPGGGAANSAVVAAACGARTRLYTRLGEDDYGQLLKENYQQLRIDLELQSCRQTPGSLVFVDPQGERTLLTLKPILEPDPTELRFPISEPDDYVLVYAHSHQTRSAYAAAAQGKLVLPGHYLQAELEAGAHWDIVLASADETAAPSLEELQALGTELFVLTAGAAGGSYWNSQGWHDFQSLPLSATDIIDTCGAGDAFAGGVLAGLDLGMSHSEAISLGVAEGGSCVQRRGAWPEVPYPLPPLLPG